MNVVKNIPTIRQMKPINSIDICTICKFIPRYSIKDGNINIGVVDKYGTVYLEQYQTSFKGVEFLAPPKYDIQSIFVSHESIGDIHINDKCIYDLDYYTTGDGAYVYTFHTEVEEPILMQKSSINEYEEIKEELLLQSLNITCLCSFFMVTIGQHSFASAFFIGGITNIIYLLLLQKEIDTISVNSHIPLFPVRIIIITIIASILLKYDGIMYGFIAGILSGKIALLVTYGNNKTGLTSVNNEVKAPKGADASRLQKKTNFKK